MRQELLAYPEIELVLQEVGHAFQVQFRKKGKPAASQGMPRRKVEAEHKENLGQVPDKLKLLEFCRKERSVKEMMAFMRLKHRETFMNNHVYRLVRDNLLSFTLPDKPKSPRQKYITTAAGLQQLNKTMHDSGE
jgi:hypothetical protein